MNSGAQMSAADLIKRLNFLVADGNLDLEDIETALRAVDGDGLQDDEYEALYDAISNFADRMEPVVRQYLAERLGGRPVQLVPRVLLGPVPRGERPDRFQPRHEVMRLQEALSALGRPLKADGDYGPATTAAVQAFQAEGGLSASGWVDSPTLLALNAALDAAGHPLLDLTPRARIRPDRVLAMKNGANTADNTAVQTALSALAAHYGEPALQLTADGQFGPRTETAVKALQRRWLLPETGIVDDTTLGAINLALEVAGQPAITLAGGVGLGKVELHFFPGSHELKVYVVSGGRLLDTYAMTGGRAQAADDPNSAVDYSPSPAGRYDVVEVSPHVAASWAWSYVPYGADLREVGGEVEYRDLGGVWRVATGPRSVFAGRSPAPLPRECYLGPDGRVAPVWRYSDFGHLRGRLRSRRTGNLMTHMIHSSADQEETRAYFADTDALLKPEAALATLRLSHGCEHVHPRDVDEMVAKGYLAPGVILVIHGYDESWAGASALVG